MTGFSPPLARIALLFAASVALTVAPAAERPAHKPSPAELAEAYQRADRIGREYESKAFGLRLVPNWIGDGSRFWYRKNLANGVKEFILVETATGKKSPAFDHGRLATVLSTSLNRSVEGTKLPFDEIEFLPDGGIRFEVGSQAWWLDADAYTVAKTEARPRRNPPRPGEWRQDLWAAQRGPQKSPDGKATARIEEHNVRIKVGDGEEFAITDKGTEKAYFSRLSWSPDSKRVIATRVTPGDRRLVHLIESSPQNEHRAQLRSRVYDQPGDKVDTFDLWILDVEARSAKPIQAEPVDYGSIPYLRWLKDGRSFTYEKMDRGYGRWRIVQVDSVTGESKALVDDDPETFVDSTAQFTDYIEGTEEILWRSERDGWGHLYLTDPTGKTSQITKGAWVVREVSNVDAKNRQIVFGASGVNAGEDPYFIHYYRVGFDGSGLTPLSPAPGFHNLQWSTNRQYYVDTYSAVDVPPVHELRRASDGGLVATLEKGDISALKASGWRAPEVFVSKARDGKTDIWGIVYRPSNFNAAKRYPVIEDIYAGPQDSFVPKTFAASRSMQSLAELGFIVVKIDGLGTRNRGKAFHDVCYKNLADAGLPDRILWMKALAAKYPYVDVSRVGVFGGSAGGQSSTGALLFHPDFYKVAVSSCGCHDNRIDKIWWNEQWMGLIGPHYEAQSNITNAAKLQGKLMLIVGELDSNVPPESTYRLGDALIKAGKDFELVMLPGFNHTGGGPYGERKRRDFFVRHLIGVEPPAWGAPARR
ncbi:MAG: prolyl oligopeptidase family serine peptidase [Fimbriimonas sp.]